MDSCRHRGDSQWARCAAARFCCLCLDPYVGPDGDPEGLLDVEKLEEACEGVMHLYEGELECLARCAPCVQQSCGTGDRA